MTPRSSLAAKTKTVEERVVVQRFPPVAARPAKRNGGQRAATIDTEALDVSVGYSLRRAQIFAMTAFASAMTKYEMRPSHYAVLVLIRSNPGLSQSTVSACLGIQKANFVTLLDGLEQRGLTERRRLGGDRRASALHLTRTGESFVKKLEAAHAALENRLATRLGERKTKQLLKLLHEFTDTAAT